MLLLLNKKKKPVGKNERRGRNTTKIVEPVRTSLATVMNMALFTALYILNLTQYYCNILWVEKRPPDKKDTYVHK